MVARFAFMQEQGGHARVAILFRIGDDGPEHAGARTVGGRRRVVVGGRVAAQFRLQAQVQRRFRHQGEQRGQFAVEQHVQLAVDIEYFLLRLERAVFCLFRDPHGQAGGRAGVAHLRSHDRVLFLDARHFLQADGVDLLRLQVRGGAAGHARLVPGRAIGQGAPAAARAAGRQVIALHEGGQALQRWHQLGRDDDGVRLRQARLVRVGKAGRQVLDGRVIDAVLRRGADELFELRQGRLRQCLRQHDALLHADLHVGDGLVYPAGQLADTAQVSVILLDRGQRLRRLAARVIGQGDGHAVHLVQWQQVFGEALEAQRRRQFIVENIVVDLVVV